MNREDNVLFCTLPELNERLRTLPVQKIAVLADTNTVAHCYPLVKNGLPAHQLISIPAGEEHKTIATCGLIWEKFTDLKLDRHALVIVVGGGVLGDMGGFCAATFKRGIDFILVPTTLLAQVDASVGGKLGVDFMNYKNQIGVFCPPKVTLICSDFLKTLPERELRSGFAEVIKHCLISDAAMWQTIRSKKLLNQDWKALASHSVAFKKTVTDTDPTESGLRKILNFGHTIGHALESYFFTHGNRIFHGEAIAMGIIMESFIARQRGLLSEHELTEASDYLISVFPKEIADWNTEKVIQLIYQDKKNKGDKILMALPDGIGHARWDIEINEKEIRQSFDYYRSL
ncbi:MAG: 3-dehydroquinate synthase [Bacteroidetes bacterium]|nr:3-dehydroquinate synthase [Bacteroidota bacterium]MBS1541366.1 3-dehydroquinate synthase [Bacteroidota bacterium]